MSAIVVDEGGFAGILLQNIQTERCLADHLSAINTVERLESARQQASVWQVQISSVVAQLHGRGYCLNYESYGRCVNQWNLFVDEDGDMWLPISFIFQMGKDVVGSREQERDVESVQQVFEEFVPKELERLQVEMGSS